MIKLHVSIHNTEKMLRTQNSRRIKTIFEIFVYQISSYKVFAEHTRAHTLMFAYICLKKFDACIVFLRYILTFSH